ncbi:MAG TPA: hypothetical protein VMK66_05160, partial [Myxococcales bacterium]|nr:hypothetical protein [Myxococcales bacterium]
YSNVGDYAREEHGMNASTAVKKVRLSRRLRERPLLRDAVRLGEITPRKAEVIAPAASCSGSARARRNGWRRGRRSTTAAILLLRKMPAITPWTR